MRRAAVSPFAQAADLQVDFIGLGVGDAILLRAGGKTLLVDGGTADRSIAVMAFFRQQDIHRLDYMVSTHTHDDHLDGLMKLIRSGFPVGSFLTHHPADHWDKASRSMHADLEREGVDVRVVSPGEQLSLGSALLTFFWDARGNVPRNVNGGSMMVHAACGERTVLLTSDVTKSFQMILADAYPHLMDVDILKAPHHGYSIMSPDFPKTTDPDLVVVTNTRAGAGSTDRQLEAAARPRYFLDGGAIHLQTDGETWYVFQHRHEFNARAELALFTERWSNE